jgi:Dolichyl-phosphate-mannose-protein mannosyltransferase
MSPTLIAAIGARIPSSPLAAVAALAFIGLVSQPIIRKMVQIENDPRLTKILRWSLVLHLAGAPAQIFVVNHFYHGVADYLQYDHAAGAIGNNFRHFDFSIHGSGESTHLIGDGALTIVGGVVMVFTGTNQLAAFFVFAWLSFLGALCFYRAFSITFPDADKRRYALMLFFLPSLLFWTADLSKEAVLSLSLGIATYGCARALQRMRGGFILIVVGSLIGVFVRPNEVALLVGAFVIAMVFRPSDERTLRGFRLIGSWIFLALVVVAAVNLAGKQLHLSTKGVSGALNSTHKNNNKKTEELATGAGSGGVPYSKDPITFPRDVYEVLFNPLPITAHNGTQLIAAAENTVIVVLLYRSRRNLKALPRAMLVRPYLLLCLVYSLAFLYSFAALGNLGLITRERTLLFPFMLVLLCVPISPKGEPKQFPWERRRVTRRQRRKAELAQWSV